MENNVLDLSQYRTLEELKAYSVAQYAALVSAADQIKKMKEEITHLKELLSYHTPELSDNNVTQVIKSPELCIVESQIIQISRRAMDKELTLEETKQLDLLIKNKRLLTGESTTMEGSTKPKVRKDISEAQLISLARIESKNE